MKVCSDDTLMGQILYALLCFEAEDLLSGSLRLSTGVAWWGDKLNVWWE